MPSMSPIRDKYHKKIICPKCKILILYFSLDAWQTLDTGNYFCGEECASKRPRCSTGKREYQCTMCKKTITGYFDQGAMRNLDTKEYGFYYCKLCQRTAALVR